MLLQSSLYNDTKSVILCYIFCHMFLESSLLAYCYKIRHKLYKVSYNLCGSGTQHRPTERITYFSSGPGCANKTLCSMNKKLL